MALTAIPALEVLLLAIRCLIFLTLRFELYLNGIPSCKGVLLRSFCNFSFTLFFWSSLFPASQSEGACVISFLYRSSIVRGEFIAN